MVLKTSDGYLSKACCISVNLRLMPHDIIAPLARGLAKPKPAYVGFLWALQILSTLFIVLGVQLALIARNPD